MSQAESLRLEPIDDGDSWKMLLWRNSPKVFKWCRQNEKLSDHEHDSWFSRIKSDPTIKMYALYGPKSVDLKCIELVGVTGLTSIDRLNSRAEVSLYIDPELHRQGLGFKAARSLTDKAFNVHNLNSIWGEAFEGSPAIGLFQKCGFKEEGRRRQFYFREGKYVDAILFSLLRSEYV